MKTLLISAWLLIAAAACAQGNDDGAWRTAVSGHSNGVGSVNSNFSSPTNVAAPTNVLFITVCQNWWSVRMRVGEDAWAEGSELHYSWAGRGSFRKQLDKTNWLELQGILDELVQTPNSVPTWITNIPSMKSELGTNWLVMVSFRHGTNWYMRQFNDALLPPVMLRCYELLQPDNYSYAARLKRGRTY